MPLMSSKGRPPKSGTRSSRLIPWSESARAMTMKGFCSAESGRRDACRYPGRLPALLRRCHAGSSGVISQIRAGQHAVVQESCACASLSLMATVAW